MKEVELSTTSLNFRLISFITYQAEDRYETMTEESKPSTRLSNASIALKLLGR